MHVKALKPHGNPFGDVYWKGKGATYSLPDVDAAPLITSKLVAEAKPADKAPGKSGNGAQG